MLGQFSGPSIKVVKVQLNVTSTIYWTTYKLGLFFFKEYRGENSVQGVDSVANTIRFEGKAVTALLWDTVSLPSPRASHGRGA